MSTITNIQRMLNDDGTFWPTTRILDAVNEAQWDCWIRSKWTWAVSTLTLTDGVDIIPLPPNIVVPRFVESNSTRFFPSTQRELEEGDRGWRTHGKGEPQFFVVWDAFNLRVFPRPNRTYTTYKLWGIGYPTEITPTNLTLQGDTTLQRAIEHLACGILFDATRPDLATYHRGLGEKQLQLFKTNLRNYQSHNIRSLKIGDSRYNLSQSGVIRELPTWYPVEC